ncbi:MAG: DUF362 domain-containing protein [candidate division NC10 bacterium]|nr:DUF362 domain-containing protein [candidate division NC10 bacterium]
MMKDGISRRSFFKYFGLAAAAAAGIAGPKKEAFAARDYPSSSSLWQDRDAYLKDIIAWIPDIPLYQKKGAEVIGTVNFRHLPVNQYRKDGKSLVSLVYAGPDLKKDIKRAVDAIGGFGKALRRTDRILLKPNFNSPDPPPAGSSLDFLAAVFQVLQDEGYTNLTLGESVGGPWGPSERVLKMIGADQLTREHGVKLLNFEEGKWMDVPLNGEFLDVMAYPASLQEFDKIIYLPVMKTHFLAGFTMGLKLSQGLIHPADKGKVHADNHIFVAQRIAELNKVIHPDLIIMDGRRSFVSGGPAHGLAIEPGFVLASGDQIANDVWGVKILQQWQAVNKLNMYAWQLPQIAQAVRWELGARSDNEVALVRV